MSQQQLAVKYKNFFVHLKTTKNRRLDQIFPKVLLQTSEDSHSSKVQRQAAGQHRVVWEEIIYNFDLDLQILHDVEIKSFSLNLS